MLISFIWRHYTQKSGDITICYAKVLFENRVSVTTTNSKQTCTWVRHLIEIEYTNDCGFSISLYHIFISDLITCLILLFFFSARDPDPLLDTSTKTWRESKGAKLCWPERPSKSKPKKKSSPNDFLLESRAK